MSWKQMDLQIKRLQTWIEKMKGVFQMDLEEIMSSQSVMNNEITETEITPDNKNSRVTEAEERLSELEDRILETNEAE